MNVNDEMTRVVHRHECFSAALRSEDTAHNTPSCVSGSIQYNEYYNDKATQILRELHPLLLIDDVDHERQVAIKLAFDGVSLVTVRDRTVFALATDIAAHCADIIFETFAIGLLDDIDDRFEVGGDRAFFVSADAAVSVLVRVDAMQTDPFPHSINIPVHDISLSAATGHAGPMVVCSFR